MNSNLKVFESILLNVERNSCPETNMATSRLVQAKCGFEGNFCADNEERKANLKFDLANFVYLLQELCVDCFI